MSKEKAKEEDGGVITSKKVGEPKLTAYRLSSEELLEKKRQLMNMELLKEKRDLDIEKLDDYLKENIPEMSIDESIQIVEELIKEGMVENEKRERMKAKPSEIKEMEITLKYLKKEKELGHPRRELQMKREGLAMSRRSDLSKGIQSLDEKISIIKKEIKSGTTKDFVAKEETRAYVQ